MLLSALGVCWVWLGLATPGALADARGQELLDYTCTNDLGRRQVTLFANGTIRLREGLYESEVLRLAELGPDELAATVARLKPREVNLLPSTEHRSVPVAGRFVEGCELRLELAEETPESYSFTRWDVPPLRVGQLVQVADELALAARPPAPEVRLPVDYEPRRGDILLTAQDERFEVLGTTSDGKAVELVSLESPIRLYLSIEELPKNFVELVEERR